MAWVISTVRGVLHEAPFPCGSPCWRPSACCGQLIGRVRGSAAGELSLCHRAATTCIRREQGKGPLFSQWQNGGHGAFCHWRRRRASGCVGQVLARAATTRTSCRDRYDNPGHCTGVPGCGQTAHNDQPKSDASPYHPARCVCYYNCVVVCLRLFIIF